MADDDVGPPDLSTHPLVDKLNPGGDTPPGRVPLIGFIGPSPKEGFIRVYRDLQFRSYYEVPRDSVHHTIPVDREDPDSPTKVLVPADTPIDVVEVTTHHVEAGFVAGNIAQGRLGFTTPPGALPGPICTTLYSCPTAACHTPPICITLWTHHPTFCPPQQCTGITTVVTCNVTCPGKCTGVTTIVTCNVTCPHGGGGGVGAADAAAAPLCTTAITCPSQCHPCTGITTVVTCNVTCKDQPGPICTTAFSCPTGPCQGGAGGGAVGAAAVAGGGNACTGITTYVTCPPHQCTGITTAVTCNVTNPQICDPAGGGGGGNACTGITTYVTCPPHQCTGITTVVTCNVTNPVICHPGGGGGGAVGFAAQQPQPLCITLYTYHPTWCPPPICLTITTAVPTMCGPAGA